MFYNKFWNLKNICYLIIVDIRADLKLYLFYLGFKIFSFF